jgi:cytochrome c2/very-short-patch-repair endonuclease
MNKISTLREFVEQANIVHGGKYDYSEAIYIKTHTKLEITCFDHGKFTQSPHHHLQGQGCPRCGNDKISKMRCGNRIKFIHDADIIHRGLYDYSKVNYKTSDKKVVIVCKLHGDFLQSPNSHLKGRGCRSCGFEKRYKSQRNNISSFIQKSVMIHGNKYDYSKSQYDGSKTRITIICPDHGAFVQKPNSHLNGQGCPKCNVSKGERQIQSWLETNGIDYVIQKTFSDCKNPKTNYKLRFDFYIPSENVLIEYDGQQHFTPVKIMGKHDITGEELEYIKYKDRLKNDYARKSGIRLVRIPYSNAKHIPSILMDSLKIS